jgi:hypothetical protein
MNFIILYLGLLTFLGINKKATTSFTLNGSSSTVLDVCGTGNTNPISSLVFNGTASQNETGHFIEIYETDAVNSNNVTGVYYSNHFSGAAGSIDLVSIYNFKDNKIYRIKLATYNGCTSWIEQVKYVRVIGKPTIIADKCYDGNTINNFPITILFDKISDSFEYKYAFNDTYTNSKIVEDNKTEDIILGLGNYTIYVRNEGCHQLNNSKGFRVVNFNSDPQIANCFDYEARLASNQEENKPEVEVVPNPTEGFLEINLKGNSSLNDIFEIYDMSGRIIYSGKENKVDLSLHPNGIYYLKYVSQSGIKIKKIIVQK